MRAMNKRINPGFALVLGIFLLLLVLMLPVNAHANEAKSMLDTFTGITDDWWGTLRGYAIDIFLLTLTLEIAIFGIRMAFQHTQLNEIIAQFVMLLLFAAFISAVIMNYEEWAKNIVLNGLKPVIAALNPGMEVVDAGKPFALAAKVWESVLKVCEGAGFFDIPKILALEIVALIICIILALISALVIIVTCEFYIVANVGILLIGLGGSKIFKDYAVNVMRYILSVAVKLFVLQLIVNIGFTILTLDSIQGATGGNIKTIQYQQLFLIVGQAIILFALAQSLPSTCAGLLSGAAIGGGNPLAMAVRSVGGMAAGAATAGAGMAMGAATAWHQAGRLNEASGQSGFINRARNILGARSEAKMEKNPHTITNTLKSKTGAMQVLTGQNAAKQDKE